MLKNLSIDLLQRNILQLYILTHVYHLRNLLLVDSNHQPLKWKADSLTTTSQFLL